MCIGCPYWNGKGIHPIHVADIQYNTRLYQLGTGGRSQCKRMVWNVNECNNYRHQNNYTPK